MRTPKAARVRRNGGGEGRAATTAPILLLVGAPGSGKGTQAPRLAAQARAVHVELGEQLRREIRGRSRLGRRIAKDVARGSLVSNAVALAEVSAVLRRARPRIVRRGAVVDGYPRTLRQARDFIGLLARLRLPNPLLVLHLRGPQRVFRARMLHRGRADDTPEVIRRRLDLYRRQATPMLRFLRRRAHIIEVSAAPSAARVARAIWRDLRAWFPPEGATVWRLG